jgi:hypothetical protein
MKRIYVKLSLFVLCFFVNTFVGISQGFPENPEGDDDPLVDPAAPIDDFIWILVFLAVFTGLYLLNKKRTPKRQ